MRTMRPCFQKPASVLDHISCFVPHTIPSYQLALKPRLGRLSPCGLARQILSNPELEGDPLSFLEVTEAYWKALKHQKHEPHKKGPNVVTIGSTPVDSPEYDVCICGGTLGVLLGLALQMKGLRVCIVEKRLVAGRTQEWNSSRHEMEVLVQLGLLSPDELEATLVSEFNPIRVGFKGGEDLWVTDVLNIGIRPSILIATVREKFLSQGGVISENTTWKSAEVCPGGVRCRLGPTRTKAEVGDTNRPTAMAKEARGPSPRELTCRLLVDCMGHYSPIVKQIRGRSKPEGMVLVMGTCAEGVPPVLNQTADLLYSMTDIENNMQMFWEAFPAEGGDARTTYMFSYSDAHPTRPTFEEMLNLYFEYLPRYQGIPLSSLRFKRVLFGGFPCYSDGPLQPGFDRIIQVGDASASQSPLSFGGFGSMLRHLKRLTNSITQALTEDRLSRADLSWIHPYQPSLSAAWLFQRSMSVPVGHTAPAPRTGPAPTRETGLPPASSADRNSPATLGTQLVVGGGGPVETLGAVPAGVLDTTPSASNIVPYHVEGAPSVAGEHAAKQPIINAADVPLEAQNILGKPRTGSATQSDTSEQPPSKTASASTTGESWLARFLMLPAHHINQLLACNFAVMKFLGERVLKPFLQDTIQLVPLTLTMWGMMLHSPVAVSRVLVQLGPSTLAKWFGHYVALLAYTLLYWITRPLRGVFRGYTFQRIFDALEYGSAGDYSFLRSSPMSTRLKDRVAAQNMHAEEPTSPEDESPTPTATPSPTPTRVSSRVDQGMGPAQGPSLVPAY